MRKTSDGIRFADGKSDLFYLEVRRIGARYLSRQRNGRYAPPVVWLKLAVLGFVAAGSLAVIGVGDPALPVRIALTVLAGGTSLLLVLLGAHDAVHNALSRRQWVNTAVARGAFWLIGVDGRMWAQRHVGSHHVFPNVNGCDADIDVNPLIRLSPNHPRRPWMRFQHFYAPVIYLLVALHSILVQDVVYIFKRRLANMEGLKHGPREVAQLVACKLVHVSLFMALPLLTAAVWWHVLVAYLAMSAVKSLAFVLLFVPTHFAEEAEFPALGTDKRLPRSWARHQMATSLDWNAENPLAVQLAGGLNAHAAHHLFPSVSHAHYGPLTKAIRRAAARHGVRYNRTTLARAVRSHFRHLRAMARDDGPEGALEAVPPESAKNCDFGLESGERFA